MSVGNASLDGSPTVSLHPLDPFPGALFTGVLFVESVPGMKNCREFDSTGTLRVRAVV